MVMETMAMTPTMIMTTLIMGMGMTTTTMTTMVMLTMMIPIHYVNVDEATAVCMPLSFHLSATLDASAADVPTLHNTIPALFHAREVANIIVHQQRRLLFFFLGSWEVFLFLHFLSFCRIHVLMFVKVKVHFFLNIFQDCYSLSATMCCREWDCVSLMTVSHPLSQFERIITEKAVC